MEVIYALVPLLGGWLVYGLIASLFLKRASSRDYLLLISSGLVGGLIGGSIGNNMDIPQNLWWMREIIKIGVTIVAMYTCLLYTSPSPRDVCSSRMPSSA